MKKEIQEKLDSYDENLRKLFLEIRDIIVACEPLVEEKLWAGLPSYYKQDKFIRLIPFKEHINIEASAIVKHGFELKNFVITPKGMMKITPYQDVPFQVLNTIFMETLN